MAEFLIVLIVAILVAIVYGFIGLVNAWAKGEPKDLSRIAATVLYSIVVGIIAAWTGVFSVDTMLSWDLIAQVISPVWWMYIGVLYAFQKLADAVFARFGWQKGLAQLFVPRGK